MIGGSSKKLRAVHASSNCNDRSLFYALQPAASLVNVSDEESKISEEGF